MLHQHGCFPVAEGDGDLLIYLHSSDADCRNADAEQAGSLKTPGLQLCCGLQVTISAAFVCEQGHQLSHLLAFFLVFSGLGFGGRAFA